MTRLGSLREGRRPRCHRHDTHRPIDGQCTVRPAGAVAESDRRARGWQPPGPDGHGTAPSRAPTTVCTTPGTACTSAHPCRRLRRRPRRCVPSTGATEATTRSSSIGCSGATAPTPGRRRAGARTRTGPGGAPRSCTIAAGRAAIGIAGVRHRPGPSRAVRGGPPGPWSGRPIGPARTSAPIEGWTTAPRETPPATTTAPHYDDEHDIGQGPTPNLDDLVPRQAGHAEHGVHHGGRVRARNSEAIAGVVRDIGRQVEFQVQDASPRLLGQILGGPQRRLDHIGTMDAPGGVEPVHQVGLKRVNVGRLRRRCRKRAGHERTLHRAALGTRGGARFTTTGRALRTHHWTLLHERQRKPHAKHGRALCGEWIVCVCNPNVSKRKRY